MSVDRPAREKPPAVLSRRGCHRPGCARLACLHLRLEIMVPGQGSPLGTLDCCGAHLGDGVEALGAWAVEHDACLAAGAAIRVYATALGRAEGRPHSPIDDVAVEVAFVGLRKPGRQGAGQTESAIGRIAMGGAGVGVEQLASAHTSTVGWL